MHSYLSPYIQSDKVGSSAEFQRQIPELHLPDTERVPMDSVCLSASPSPSVLSITVKVLLDSALETMVVSFDAELREPYL